MWIFTNKGFISAVENRDDKTTLIVRARNRKHLKDLFPRSVITKTPSADYMYRAIIPKGEAATTIAMHVLGIDYDNFKNSIKEDEYHMACSGVWHVMYNYQDALSDSVKELSQ